MYVCMYVCMSICDDECVTEQQGSSAVLCTTLY